MYARVYRLTITTVVSVIALTAIGVPMASVASAVVLPITDVVDVSLGRSHSCSLHGDGTVKCWGDNFYGQLGDGTTTDSSYAVTVVNGAGTAPLGNVIQISVGDWHSCALLENHTERCWGYNINGVLGDGTTTNRSRPVVVQNKTGIAPLTNVVEISSGQVYGCARLLDTSVRCWGYNGSGQLGDGTNTSWPLPVKVKNAAGTGTLTNATRLATGSNHTCALIVGGTARCWGYNFYGQVGDGTFSSRSLPVMLKNGSGTGVQTDIVQIVGGSSHTCARLTDNTARCWGNAMSGALGDGGTVNRSLPRLVKNPAGTAALANVIDLDLGVIDTCARLVDTTVRCWGANDAGQLGDGSTTNSLYPRVVKNGAGTATLTNAASLGVGDDHVCVSLVSGGARCWGRNDQGQLGMGSTSPWSALPVVVVT